MIVRCCLGNVSHYFICRVQIMEESDVQNWTTDDVLGWLEANDLGSFKENFIGKYLFCINVFL